LHTSGWSVLAKIFNVGSRRAQLLHLAGLGLLGCALACVSIPSRRYAIDSIGVSGNHALDDTEIEEHIATRDSPKFLGLFSGVVYDYEVFDRYVLERDLQRIERYYRSRGFYWPHVRAGRVFETGPRKVKVEILVEEGPETKVGRVDIHGLEGLPEPVVREASSEVAHSARRGRRFEEADFEAAAIALEDALTDHGYAHAKVRRAADVDLVEHVASLGYWVDPGRPARLGDIQVSGLEGIPEAQVRRTLNLKPGEPYSRSELDSAERALLDLGVFSSVSVQPQLDVSPVSRTDAASSSGSGSANPSNASSSEVQDVVPINVKLQRSRFRSLRFGGGLQIDSQRTDVHLVAGWEDRNFLGGLRSLQIEFVPGGVVYPTRLPDLDSPERLLPQARLRLEFRQPSFLEARTAGVLRTEASLVPALLSSNRDAGDPILGYRDLRASAGLERSLFWKLNGTLSQNLQISDPFTYVGALDPDLDTAIVSYPELVLRLDARNDRLEPSSGVYASTSLQLAGLGGDARDLKVQPEVRGYVPLGRLTFAARGTFGFLFAQNYGDTIASDAFTGTSGGASRATWVRDLQLMYLRGFFGGGPGSNRGYGQREIGPHGAVPFYNPGQSSLDPNASCNDTQAPGSGPPPADCDLPLGGFSLWEVSAELRFPLLGPLRGAVFVDTADVSPYQLSLRWDRPHLSTGVGLRYATPIGPVRFDVGYRVPGLQAPASADEARPAELFGLPVAISIGIGEPF
jgi:outer membrane protein assembly factor BamA